MPGYGYGYGYLGGGYGALVTTSTIGWTVEVDADPDTTGEFVIGTSLIGGADLIAPDERWVDVGQVVRHISIRRGRTDDARPYDAGEVVVVFDNRTGDFDPDNPYGHYVMGSKRLLGQGTGFRVKAAVAEPVTMFTGRVEEPVVSDDPFNPVATYTCVDGLAELAKVDVPWQRDPRGDTEASSARANWLLDQAAISTSDRDVESGGRQLLGTVGGGTVRDALQRVANGEAGRFYVTRTGAVTLTWHDAEYAKTSVVDFTDTGGPVQYMGMQTSSGAVTNTVTVHRVPPRMRNPETGQFVDSPEIPDVVAQDNDSAAQYGILSVTVDCDLANDADAADLAEFGATRRSQPIKRLTQVVTQPLESYSATVATDLLTLELGSLITLSRWTYDHRPLYFQATVEGIQVDAVPGVTKMTLSTAPSDTASLYGSVGWFIIGTSLIGGPDVIAPY